MFGKVGDAAAVFDEPLPEEGESIDDVLRFVRERVMAYPMGNSHPRFFGFINATADPVGITADYLAAALNPNCWGGDHAGIHVEQRVIRWLSEILGYPPDADGILVSGGSMANFTALAVARRAVTPGNVREDGVAGEGHPRPVVYASDQVHHCVDKAVDLLGIGTRNLRRIESDSDFRMSMDRLRDTIAADRRAGLAPAILVGSAGTVNTGAIDPLGEMADLAREEGLWFHVDGAYGAMAAVSPRLRGLFGGMERADSIAADPHKWMYVPFEAGATLVRQPGRMAAAFRKFPEYLASDAESPFPGPAWFAERGVELSRGFKALKVWMGLKVHGRRGYAAAIERDVALARFLSEAVDAHPDLERLSEPVAVDRKLPVSPGGRLPKRRRARSDQPPHHQPVRRVGVRVSRTDDPQGPHGASRGHRELPDDAGGSPVSGGGGGPGGPRNFGRALKEGRGRRGGRPLPSSFDAASLSPPAACTLCNASPRAE